MTSFQLYCLIKLDALQNMFEIIFGALLFTWGITLLMYLIIKEQLPPIRKGIILPVIAILFFMFGMLFTPTTKEMAVILVTPKIINAVSENEELKKLPSNVLDLANQWIEELKPDTGGKK